MQFQTFKQDCDEVSDVVFSTLYKTLSYNLINKIVNQSFESMGHKLKRQFINHCQFLCA